MLSRTTRLSRTTTALVLGSRDQGEQDRWVRVLSAEFGKLSLLAKGVRQLNSRRRPALQAGAVVRLSWIERGEIAILTEVALLESLAPRHANLERWRDFSACLEIVMHLSLEGLAQPELYAQAVTVLRAVGQDENYQRGLVRQQLWSLLAEQGVVAAVMDGQSVSEALESFTGTRLHSFAFLRV